jgi:Histidine kinase-, DNA gyrase B-, and HSP90-like ATPase
MKGQNHSDPSLYDERAMAMLGHELDNVLNGLLGMTRLLRESGLNPEQERWSRAIEQSGRQMHRLVACFRSGPGPSDREPLPCALPTDGIDLLEQALISHTPSALASGNRLLMTVEPDVPYTWHCDPCRLRQVIDNLLGNALKFTTAGEVRLHAARACPGSDRLRIRVLDSGPGIDPAVGNRIFEPWEQGHEDIRRDFGGSGLGLYICQLAAMAMGGTLSWSTPGSGGACFEACFPGMLRDEGEPPERAPRLLRRVHCVLHLREPLRGSVIGWLARLGVGWHDAGATTPPAASGGLLISVSELPVGADPPGPTLLLKPVHEGGRSCGDRSVAAPILGCNLGPALFGMVLEWWWVSDERRDSIP